MRPGERPPPLLDRLLSDSAVAEGDPAAAAVRRTLEDLLNTRWRALSWPEDLEELDRSLIDYGIPDFTGATFNDPMSRRELRTVLERSIRKYEPRLRSVRVIVTDREVGGDRTIRFVVEAMLGHRDPVAFETTLDPSTSEVRIERGAR
jgi:type VI secretion system protein ImpF